MCSEIWSFRMWDFKILVKNPSPISALGVKSRCLQFVRVNQLLCSNPTSSITTSLNTQNTAPRHTRAGAVELVRMHEGARASLRIRTRMPRRAHTSVRASARASLSMGHAAERLVSSCRYTSNEKVTWYLVQLNIS